MNEKMRVLELLENGKITADEAARLIEALGTSSIMSRETRENMEEKWHKFAHDVGEFAKDAGCKVQAYYKKVEPQLKKASQSALEQAAAALDTLACKVRESLEKGECCSEICECESDCKCEDDNTPKPN